MGAIASLLVVVATSVLITRIATSALVMTGVSRELANFQARSAYTGVGFTTNEAETVVAHGVRRKIILTLMLLGSAGVAGAIASLVAGFAQAGSLRTAAIRLAVLMVGLGLLWWLTTLDSVERLLRRVIERGLERWTDLHVLDYVQLLGMERGYEVREVKVMEGDWLAYKRLDSLDLPREGVLVLALRRSNGAYLGAPHPHTEIAPGDTIFAYGRPDNLAELEERQAGGVGDKAHENAVATQRSVQTEEAEDDPESGPSAAHR